MTNTTDPLAHRVPPPQDGEVDKRRAERSIGCVREEAMQGQYRDAARCITSGRAVNRR